MRAFLVLTLVFSLLLAGCSSDIQPVRFTGVSIYEDPSWDGSPLSWRAYGLMFNFELFGPPADPNAPGLFGPWSKEDIEAMNNELLYQREMERLFPEPP